MLNKAHTNISVCFILKADKKIGGGHLVRCRVLAEALKKQAGCKVKFFSGASSVKGPGFDICITDSPDINRKDLGRLKKYTKLLVSIDDGNNIYFSSDILISPNVNPDVRHRFSRSTKYLSGRDYIILKEGFEKTAHKRRDISKDPRHIFICFGGSDPNNLTERLIKILKDSAADKKIKINLVLGPLFGSAKRVETLIAYDNRYVLRKGVSDLAGILQKCDLAIISGGTLLYEACILGAPAIVISQNKRQDREAGFFAAKKAVVNLGTFNGKAGSRVLPLIVELLSDYKRRKQLSVNARRLISGRGADRIASLILREYRAR